MGSLLDFLWAKERRTVLWGGGTLLGLVLVAFLFLGIALRVAASEAQQRAEKLHQEISLINETNERLVVENEKLRRAVSSLKEPQNVAKSARDDLGMVKDDELVFFVTP